MIDELPTRTDLLEADSTPSREEWPPCPWNHQDLPKVLVGREAELDDLNRAFEDVVSDWRPRIQLVLGESGVGKSRLLREFCRQAREREPALALVRLHCPSEGGPYRLWDAMLRACFGVLAHEPTEQAALQVKAAAEAYVKAEHAQLLSQLVYENGEPSRLTPLEEMVLVGRWAAALVSLLEALAFESALLLALDDVDAASAADLVLLSAIGSAAKGRPYMVVLAGSPHLRTHISGWEQWPHLHLWPLSELDHERLARLYLDGLSSEVEAVLLPWLLAESRGNPEALRALCLHLHEAKWCRLGENGWELDEAAFQQQALSEFTFEALLQVHIQALPEVARHILAQGASMGREFYLGALKTIAFSEPNAAPSHHRTQLSERIDEAISHLVEARFIEARTTPLRGEDSFMFRSLAHQAAALKGVPVSMGQRWRKSALEWLEQHVDGLDDDMLSSTYLRDLSQLAEGVGDLSLAAQYALKAGRVALKASHVRLALGFFEEALRLVPLHDVGVNLRIHMALGELHVQMGTHDLALTHLQAALSQAEHLVDRRSIARACRQIANLEVGRGEYVAAQQSLLDAIEASRLLDDAGGMARGDLALGHIYRTLGELDLAQEAYQRARDYFGWQSEPRGLAEVHQAEGSLAYERGQWDVAIERLEASLWAWRSLGDLKGEMGSLNNLGAVMLGKDPEQALTLWNEAYKLACELSDLPAQAMLRDNLGEAYVRLARYDEAFDVLQSAVELAEATQRRTTLIDALRNLCLVEIARQRFDSADEYLLRAEREASHSPNARLNATLLHVRGELALALAEETTPPSLEDNAPLPMALAAFEKAATTLHGQGYLLAAADSWDRFAQASFLAGAPKRAQEALAQATHLRAQGAPPPPLPHESATEESN